MKNRDIIVEAGSRVLRSTPRKLNLVADLVRNKKVSFANVQLRFCEKKAAGKSLTLRRVYPKAMGRANRMSKFYSNITIKLKEIV
nr:unnamed protein product [Callosobruchus chinensis]